MAPGAALAYFAVAIPTTGSCINCWVLGQRRPERGPPVTSKVLEAMSDAEPALASSGGAEPAGAAAGQDTGRESKAPAAPDSPGRPSAQAASGAAGTDAAEKSGSWAEAARPDSVPGEPGARAAACSAGEAPDDPYSVTAAGRAAAGNSTGQLHSHEAGRQPADTGSSHREASSRSRAACLPGKQQAAHDGQDQDASQVCCCGPSTPPLMPILTAVSGCGVASVACSMAGLKVSAIACAQALPSLHIAGH